MERELIFSAIVRQSLYPHNNSCVAFSNNDNKRVNGQGVKELFTFDSLIQRIFLEYNCVENSPSPIQSGSQIVRAQFVMCRLYSSDRHIFLFPTIQWKFSTCSDCGEFSKNNSEPLCKTDVSSLSIRKD